jgi:hypothetical protein
MNYRIVESLGGFIIQVEVEFKRGVLGRKKTKEWVNIDIYGLPRYEGYCYSTPTKTFTTLKDAKKFISLIKRGAVIHEV